jgi:hypothetical protein
VRMSARGCALGLLLAAAAARGDLWQHDEFDREEAEESAGSSFQFFLNPNDDIYGISFGDGTWIKGTPVFGDLFLSLFQNGIEDTWYSSIGMTIRLMPHWTVAPFVGGGGSYNYSLSNRSTNAPPPVVPPADGQLVPVDRGESYWAGHAEAGVRVWMANRVRLLEIMGRYTWTSFEGDGRDYWMVGVSTGTGF